MAEPIPCPSCKSLLRIPEGAERIRCPQCKSEVTLKPAIPKGVPLPAVKPAIPLPFDKPPKGVPLPPEIPRARSLPQKPLKRGKVVREEEEPVRKSRKQKYDEDLRNDKNFERVDAECRYGRIGTRLLSVAAAFATVQSLCFGIFLGSVAIAHTPEPITLLLSLISLGAHLLFLVIGYGFCCAGPKGMRSTAGIGIGVTILHAALIIPVAMLGFALVGQHFKTTPENNIILARVVFTISSAMNNLDAPTDFPWILLGTDFQSAEGRYIAMICLGCLLEFTKMCVLGTIVQYYASEGKSFELSFRSLKFVYRILWVIGVVAVAKFAVLIIMFQFLGAESVRDYFYIPQTLFTVGYFFWWAFAWYGQYETMTDTIDILTTARFLDRRRSLEDYY